jgi:hypothetical protein
MICISQLNLFGAQAPALKPVEAPKHDREREKKKIEFFGRLHTQIHRKPTLFRKVSYKKPKNGTLVTTEFGGDRYQSSIGICRGPSYLLSGSGGYKHVRCVNASYSIRDSASTASLFMLCSITMRQGGYNQLIPSVYIKMGPINIYMRIRTNKLL